MVRDITTVVTVLGFGALFVIFGMLHSTWGGCSGCSCGDGACRKHDTEGGST